MDERVARTLRSLEQNGLNQWGVVSAERYDRTAPEALKTETLFPGTQSILVIGSGGRELWDCFVAELHRRPTCLSDEPHPIDAYVLRAVASASGALEGVNHRWFWASQTASIHLDFRSLAVAAGLGAPSRLGLVLNSKVGPWMAMRAAVFLPLHLAENDPAPELCSECDAPCVEACPGAAFPEGQWDAGSCVQFHKASDVCSNRCVSRRACPVGAEFMYSELQEFYHSNRRDGRIALAQVLDIEQDKYEGEGPF